MNKGAVLSDDKKYRYQLWRIWDETKPNVFFLMLNPSTADESKDDATIRRCISFAKDWGYGGIYVGNLFPYRATNPRELLGKKKIEIAPLDNYKHQREMARKCELNILAYGVFASKFNGTGGFIQDVEWHYLKLTKSGAPAHPLYLKSDLKPIKFSTI